MDLANTSLGPLSAARLTAGSALTAADAHANDVLVNSSYATAHKLSVGKKLAIGGTSFTITGIASVPQSGNPPDAYIPLAKAQSIGQASASARLSGQVNSIYVSAASATDIPAVQAGRVTCCRRHGHRPGQPGRRGDRIAGQRVQPGRQPGPLAVGRGARRRVRRGQRADHGGGIPPGQGVRHPEGARLASRRVVGQVMGESFVIGVGGAVLGVALGYGGTALIDALAPKLTATVGASNAASVRGAGRPPRRGRRPGADRRGP